jgi:hypothetical protein
MFVLILPEITTEIVTRQIDPPGENFAQQLFVAVDRRG